MIYNREMAEKFPFLKNFDFYRGFDRNVISVEFLIPRKKNPNLFNSEKYFIGEALLINYVQEDFNRGSSVEISRLVKEIEEENTYLILGPSLKKLKEHKILVVKEEKLCPESNLVLDCVLSSGVNYNKTRVRPFTEFDSSLDTRSLF